MISGDEETGCVTALLRVRTPGGGIIDCSSEECWLVTAVLSIRQQREELVVSKQIGTSDQLCIPDIEPIKTDRFSGESTKVLFQ